MDVCGKNNILYTNDLLWYCPMLENCGGWESSRGRQATFKKNKYENWQKKGLTKLIH